MYGAPAEGESTANGWRGSRGWEEGSVSPSGTYLDSAVLDRVVDVMLSRSGSVVLALTDAGTAARA